MREIRSVAYVIGSYPLLTTTFIDREIDVLRNEGVVVDVFSLRPPHGQLSEDQSTADVTYARPIHPLRLVAAHLSFLVRRPRAYWSTLAGLVTGAHPTFFHRIKTIGHFALAVHVAGIIRRAGGHQHVHAHFVDRAAVVALVVGRLLDLPYSATAHANDIYVDPVLLDRKLSEAKFVATCTEANAEHLRALGERGRIVRLYHGLDVAAYDSPERGETGKPTFLAVGQLKEKKGFIYLIEACRMLAEQGVDFRTVIIGEGPLRGVLEDAIAAAGLDERFELRGAMSHRAVKEAYQTSDLFVLPCIVASDGDRDGIPNVILEAMASGLPVVSTRHSGIPEAVEDGTSGLLVPPADASALADALATLAGDPDMRVRFGEAGRKLVADSFDHTRNVRALLEEFAR